MNSQIDPEQNAPEDTIQNSNEYEFIKSPTLSDYLKSYAALFVISGSILFLDQLSKDWVRANMAMYEAITPIEWLAPYIRILHAENTGAAFGIFKQAGGIFTILAVVVSLVIAYYYPRIPNRDWPFKLALALQLGGAIGNLYDRLLFGAVTDFIAVGNFPIFNVADSSVTVGVAILILTIWITERRDKAAMKLALQSAGDSTDLEVGEQA